VGARLLADEEPRLHARADANARDDAWMDSVEQLAGALDGFTRLTDRGGGPMMFAIDLNPIDDIVSGVFGLRRDVIGHAFKLAFTWVVGFIVSGFVNAARHVIDQMFALLDAASDGVAHFGLVDRRRQPGAAEHDPAPDRRADAGLLAAGRAGRLWHGNPGEIRKGRSRRRRARGQLSAMTGNPR
jgi:hypothetical protein